MSPVHDHPQSIGRYTVESLVGAGAAGVVYRAHDPLLDRLVAIKVPRTGDITDDQMTELSADFYHEASIAGRFQHPNVVTIYDVGRDRGLDFMVMELVEGCSGRELLNTSQGLPVWDVLSIVYDCCRALDFIHYRGIVHRDIKPGNVLVGSARDHSKIADFSIAHRVDDVAYRGRGTLAYVSPECLTPGMPVDQRSDLFGMGATMYEFLTGNRPFGSSGSSTVDRILNEPPELIDASRLGIPESIVAIVMKALEKRAEDRFESALDFADAVYSAKRSLEVRGPDTAVAAGDAYVSLRRSEWFGSFAPEQVNEMLEVGETKMYSEGEAIVCEGEPGDAFYLLLHGSAVVVKHDQVIGRVSTGEFFGEIALVATETRSASVVAAEPVMVWKVGRALLDRASHSSRAGFYKVFLSVLARRLDELTRETAELRAASAAPGQPVNGC